MARYTLAVPRKYKGGDGQPDCDFINCISFGKNAEFAEKYLHKGIKIAVVGRIQTSNYINKDGVKVYTTDIVAEEQEFAESKSASQQDNNNQQNQQQAISDSNDFMNLPDDIPEELPFQ